MARFMVAKLPLWPVLWLIGHLQRSINIFMAFKGKYGAIKVKRKRNFEFSGAETLFWNCRWPFELFVRQTQKFKNFFDRFMFNKFP